MLDVRRLRLLCDLAQLGTIAAVAKSHTYTPSAVSQQLAALEREAGVRLLERTGRRVVLTPAGHLLVRHGEQVLAALEGARAAMATAGGELSGPLRIGAFPSAVRTLLPGALVTLGRDHPGLELMVTELDPVAVPEALRERRLDVALVHDYDIMPVEPDQALDAVPLLEETVFLAVPAEGFAEAGGDPVGATRDRAWIAGSPGTACHAVTLQVCRTAGFTPRVRHHADDFAAVLALVAAGLGVSLVPQLATAQPPAGVVLVPLATRRRTRVTYRRGAAAHPAVAACVTALRSATADHLGE
ncbi:DNA-binding transcriptional LysR family regulator [Allocatelliglobosispora scoriae]|uniref:DNA-binding transcriptional LysR family regulator n=1 Tax=Allocatelliglobosispora scoriae TaxID=643052 RepID=A0A841BFN7_9ACTN|nr:LysR substrate-binding domain-containing protein [Allocatelliglobosispora scoriae]MBB5867104.1 DNA-binding transcriptional LysR family regulator [Allocatelliglobosispora scoriae]